MPEDFYNVEWTRKDEENWKIMFRCASEGTAIEYANRHLAKSNKQNIELRIVHYTGVVIRKFIGGK